MPIKLPKGFARRKSSGNALEELENPPQSSFRVFERPSTERSSFSDGNLMTQKAGDGRPSYSPPEEDDNIFARSDGPAVRNLTGGNTLEGPSTRFSSSGRRSTDLQTQFDSHSPHSRNLHDIPAPPFSSALRAAGRTFSFGGRFAKTPAHAPRPSSPDTTRSRATTNSTTSTATPPKLLESEFQIGRMDDFGNMFDDIGKQERQDTTVQKPIPPPHKTATYPREEEKARRPAPISTDRSKDIEPSPYSWGSRHSEEGLLTGVDSPQEDTPALRDVSSSTPMPAPLSSRRRSIPISSAVPANTTTHRSLEKPNMATDKGLRRSILYSTKRDTVAIDDEDAKMVMASLNYNKRISQAVSSNSEADDDVPLFAHKPAVPQQQPVPAQNDDSLENSIAANARLAAEYESKPIPASSSNKVMTPSQFEHYRQQQELKRANSDASDSEESAVSDFDEEDEAEKNRETERQRRKQEAHMSVYRQQMMKVTGQQAPSPSLRPETDRASSSTPNLATLSLHPGSKPAAGSGKSSEGDDDEEIPLGILAAHGFPNKNRPPSRLMSSNSMQNLRASYQQPPHLGSAGSDFGGNRSSLPVFARNLPRDPYFGASLVTPSNRESLALGGGGGGGSVYGGPSPAVVGPSPALPPGGLVSVIATEERARAMRRGSPNTQAMYDHQPTLQGPAGNMGGIPRPYTMLNMNQLSGPPPMSATEQAQIQLSQQMGHMMEMQMQWMQQMIQLQGGGQAPPPQLPPLGNPQLSFAVNPSRPSSMPVPNGALGNAPPGYGGSQRTMSMLDPNVSSRLNSPAMPPFASGANRPGTPGGGGYAHSLAPSERSNVGLAPRYRPVSTVPVEAESTNFLPLNKPWNDENRRMSTLPPPSNTNPPNSTIRPVSSYSRTLTAPSKLGSHVQVEEEDDDEGWAEMMKKREKKRSNWKVKKETSSFGDLLNAVH
ncbi:hypothetical protein BJX68DRAFT_20523 [Aspergillus pseudodeflectus]|uniref:Uncharacterized protein n=1 Tax=Aspergillus pseudodeflectus TaxID=176178 RepID=A0ABR4KRY0_9EURO